MFLEEIKYETNVFADQVEITATYKYLPRVSMKLAADRTMKEVKMRLAMRLAKQLGKQDIFSGDACAATVQPNNRQPTISPLQATGNTTP